MESTPALLDLFLFLLVTCFGAGGLLPLLFGFFSQRKELLTSLSMIGASVGSLVTILCAAVAWQDPLQSSDFFLFAPMGGMMPNIAFLFYADRLAAFFLLLTGVFGLAVTLHLASWLENTPDRHRIAAVFNLFVLCIVLTILSDTVYSFLFFQESMTLTFAYLALFRHNLSLEKEGIPAKELEASKTAFKAYLIFEHVGIMLIVIALLMLAVPGPQNTADALGFAHFRAHAAQGVSTPYSNLIFLLALAGFGIKAGIFPAHVWVPMVHPFSPTSIHAMMSGIALKVAGIYGLYRVFFFFLSPVQWWWGWLVLLLAGVTALFGVFYAILAKDLKTALASHSVENIGIILAGIGLALIFIAESGVPFESTPLYALLESAANPHLPTNIFADTRRLYLSGLAGLSLIASLYHLANHSIFKGLLFFCTGAIENRTGVVALDRLGGLMKRYPLTSTAFLIGSVSIAGFPPFNGFASEWLLLQTMFAGMDVFFSSKRILLLVGLVAAMFCLILAFSLTALAFVKIAGETLLGAPRDPQVAQNARPGEVRWPMRVVLVTFSVLCLLAGMLPTPVTQFLGRPAADMVAGFNPGNLVGANYSLTLDIPLINPQILGAQPEQPSSGSSDILVKYQTRLSNRMLLAFGLILGAAISLSLLYLRRRKKLLTNQPWTGGAPYSNRLMQYTGAAFASLIWNPFQLRDSPGAVPEPGGEEQDPLPYREFITARRYVPELTRQGFNDLLARLLAVSEKIGIKAQPGDIRVYLQYIFILFILILIFLLFAQGGGR